MSIETTVTETTKAGAIVTVSVESCVQNATINADGHIIDTGKRSSLEFVTVSIITKQGEKVFSRSLPTKYNEREKSITQAFAQVGDSRISEDAYNLIMRLYEQACKNQEKEEQYNAVQAATEERNMEAEKNAAEIEKMEVARREHSGWCDKCQSYCYGDCAANA